MNIYVYAPFMFISGSAQVIMISNIISIQDTCNANPPVVNLYKNIL